MKVPWMLVTVVAIVAVVTPEAFVGPGWTIVLPVPVEAIDTT